MSASVNILLIDDNIKTHDMFSFALNDLKINYSCRFAQNVEQAMNIMHRKPADYIFVDVNMRALNGFNTIKKFVTTPFITTPSIFIYTDQPENELCKKAIKLGVLKALKKKTEIFELIQDLKNILFKNNQ